MKIKIHLKHYLQPDLFFKAWNGSGEPSSIHKDKQNRPGLYPHGADIVIKVTNKVATSMWQSLGHGCNCPEKICYLKNAKDKGKQHIWKGRGGKKAHKTNQQIDQKIVDLWLKRWVSVK